MNLLAHPYGEIDEKRAKIIEKNKLTKSLQYFQLF